MIKKSVFENDLIVGMQRELRAHDKTQGMNNLVKAAEYLHSAIDIFEEAGLTSKADEVLKILQKIAGRPENPKAGEVPWGLMPEENEWSKHGVSSKDLRDYRSDSMARARVNRALRKMEYPEDRISLLLGKHKMNEAEVDELLNPKGLGRISDWISDPYAPVDPSNPQPGETISLRSVDSQQAEDGPRNPAKVSDRHTKGLTPDKMVANIKNHGHPMNLADDGSFDIGYVDIPQPESFDEDYRRYEAILQKHKKPKKPKKSDIDPDLIGLIEVDEDDSDDLLNADFDDQSFVVTDDEDSSKTFEDSE